MDLPISCSECKMLYFHIKDNGIDTLTVTDLISYHDMNHQVIPTSALPSFNLDWSSSSSFASSSETEVTVATVVKAENKEKVSAIRTRAREATYDGLTIHFEWFRLEYEGKEQLYLPVGDIAKSVGYKATQTTLLAKPYGSLLISAAGIRCSKRYFTLRQALQFLKQKPIHRAQYEFIQATAQRFEAEYFHFQPFGEVDAMLLQ